MRKTLALAMTAIALSGMSLSASSKERIICIICIGVDDGPPAVGAGSWCEKWTQERRRALVFTDDQIDLMPRRQRESLKSIKADIRRECRDQTNPK